MNFKEHLLIASEELEGFLFKILSSGRQNLFQRVSLSLKKWNSVGGEWLLQQYHNR